MDGPLQGLSSFDATWLVESHHELLDPANLLPGWFAERYPLITEQFPAGCSCAPSPRATGRRSTSVRFGTQFAGNPWSLEAACLYP